MPSLRELQQRFAESLLAKGGTTSVVALAGEANGTERLGIYRRTIRSNYRNALGATFPVLHRLIGTSFFHAAADAFAEEHPSRSGDLNEYGATFGDFLAGYPPASELPYLPDMARLEWAIDDANRAADSHSDPELVLRTLAGYQGGRLPSLQLRMDPSCRLIASPYPLFRIWQVNQPGHDGEMRVAFDTGADRLRIRREPAGVVLDRVAAGQFVWLCAMSVGANLGAAIEEAQDADAAFDLAEALHRFIGDGTITGIIALE